MLKVGVNLNIYEGDVHHRELSEHHSLEIIASLQNLNRYIPLEKMLLLTIFWKFKKHYLLKHLTTLL